MTMTMTTPWLYLDAATGAQKGPMAEDIIRRLLRKGLLQPDTLVWAKHLKEWTPLAATAHFQAYARSWSAFWYYMVDAERKGPVGTKALIELFVDGDVDGLTLVWTDSVNEWKPIGDVPLLKQMMHEVNEDMDRAAEVMEHQAAVAEEEQVFAEQSVEAFVAEDGKQYVFDAETKKWVTPEDKIADDLEAMRDGAAEDGAAAAPRKRASSIDEALAATKHAVVVKREEQKQQTEQPSEAADPEAAAAAAVKAAKRKKKSKKKKNKWQASKQNTWVYVNGLPLDITIKEVHDHFAKCGVIQEHLVTGEPRIKLYHNKELGGLNGDASVCYMKEASVELAVQLLDKSEIRPEWKIDVTPAVFEQKGSEFVERKRIKLDARAKVKRIEQEKALSWNEGEDGERAGLRIVVLKHMFTLDDMKDPTFEEELQSDLESECGKIGEVTKITIFSKHVDGVVVVKFASSGSAAKCIEVMNGRFFAGRKLQCGFWDGTDYTYRESKVEENERSEKFKQWLEGGSSDESEDENDAQGKNGRDGSEDERVPSAEAVHAGRVLPPIRDGTDDDEDDDDDDDDDDSIPTAEAVHAGRVMPPMDDD